MDYKRAAGADCSIIELPVAASILLSIWQHGFPGFQSPIASEDIDKAILGYDLCLANHIWHERPGDGLSSVCLAPVLSYSLHVMSSRPQ